MPLFSVRKSPKTLYRGHHIPQKEGDILNPCETPTCEGEKIGKVVYASSNLWHASAYGLKFRPARIGTFTVNGITFPYVMLGFPGEHHQSFDTILKGKTCLQLVASEQFKKGVFSKKPNGSEKAVEWVSHKPVEVRKVWTIPNNLLLYNGVQVFTTDANTLDVMNSCHPDELGKLIRSGLVCWENWHPRFDNTTTARPPFFTELLGINKPNCKRHSCRSLLKHQIILSP